MSRKIAPTRGRRTNRLLPATCEQCGGPFLVSTKRSPRPRFCSYRCGSLARWQRELGADRERFAARVTPEPNTGCWIWIGHVGDSYGGFHIRGKRVTAHRAAWELFRGPVAEGLEVCHGCDVDGLGRHCANPAHLFLGTHAENMADMAAKGRGTNQNPGKTHCPAGHPYDEENTLMVTDRRRGRQARQCRECCRQRRRAWGERRKEQRP